MHLFETIADLRGALAPERQKGRSIGLVPTMGALHDGHLSLIRRAREDCDVVVASVFVNPTQFGPSEDLASYPRDRDGDARKAATAGVDAIFAPSAAEMYPQGFSTWVLQEGTAAETLEGEARPAHFRGVLTVCLKLFNLVQPHRAYFGHKDYQQSLVVRRMVRDLGLPLEIVVCPTVREPDGLAMSSRNAYLDPDARRQAVCISRGLGRARDALAAGQTSAEKLALLVRTEIESAGPCEIDYVVVRDAETLAAIDAIDRPCIALVAVRIAGTRLIDNTPLEP